MTSRRDKHLALHVDKQCSRQRFVCIGVFAYIRAIWSAVRTSSALLALETCLGVNVSSGVHSYPHSRINFGTSTDNVSVQRIRVRTSFFDDISKRFCTYA